MQEQKSLQLRQILDYTLGIARYGNGLFIRREQKTTLRHGLLLALLCFLCTKGEGGEQGVVVARLSSPWGVGRLHL